MADDVHAEHAVGLGIGQNLHETVGRRHRPRPPVGGEGEAADRVIDSGLLKRLLRQPDGGDLGRGVDHAGDRIVVHVRGLPRDDLGGGDPFFLGLVREHRPGDHVADGVDAWRAGLEALVDLDAALPVQRDAHAVEAEAFRVGPAADRHQHHVHIERCGLTARDRLHGEPDALVGALGAGDLGAELEGELLAAQQAVHLRCDLAVHPGQDAVEELDHRDLGAEAAPDRAHFEADVTTADHGHTRRHLRQRERAGGGDDALLVHVHAGERCGDAPGRDHHRTGRDSAGLRALDLDRAGACEARVALQVGHVVVL